MKHLIECFRANKYCSRDQVKYGLPLTLLKIGDREAAHQICREYLVELSDIQYPAANDYRRFANCVLNSHGLESDFRGLLVPYFAKCGLHPPD